MPPRNFVTFKLNYLSLVGLTVCCLYSPIRLAKFDVLFLWIDISNIEKKEHYRDIYRETLVFRKYFGKYNFSCKKNEEVIVNKCSPRNSTF